MKQYRHASRRACATKADLFRHAAQLRPATGVGCFAMLMHVNAAKVTNQEFQKKGSEVHEDWKVKWEGAEM